MAKKHLYPELKQVIITQYSTRQPTPSFRSLSREFNLSIPSSTLSDWKQQWDGTIQSLKHKKGGGRHRILKKTEVTRYIRQPIQRKNRSHTPIHYPDLLPRVVQNSGRDLSIQTLRRYGNKDAEIKNKSTTICTEDECKCTIQYLLCLFCFIFNTHLTIWCLASAV